MTGNKPAIGYCSVRGVRRRLHGAKRNKFPSPTKRKTVRQYNSKSNMKNLIEKYLGQELFKKGYFNAPITDLVNFSYGKQTCPVCEQIKSKFIMPPSGGYDKCCIDCLKQTKLEFIHESEFGIVTLEKLPFELDYDEDIKKHVSEDQIKEMLQTPQYKSFNSGMWRIHCKDFMEFIGIWEPADFTLNSPDSNGKKLFLEMTEDSNHLWDECELKEDELEDTWEDVQYYTFICKHCGRLRGYWES